MEYCAPLGIPHSRFLGWSPEDRSKAVSYTAWKKKFCSGCGTESATWLDTKGEAVEPPPYMAETQHCLGCAMLEEARGALPKDAGQSYKTFLRRASLEDVVEWQMKPSVSDW